MEEKNRQKKREEQILSYLIKTQQNQGKKKKNLF